MKGCLDAQKDLNLLFVTYEELHQDPRSTIRKLSEFLGRPLGPREEDTILEHSSFSFMSQSKMVNYSLLPKEILDQSQNKFLRKGRPPSQPPFKYPQPILGPVYPHLLFVCFSFQKGLYAVLAVLEFAM